MRSESPAATSLKCSPLSCHGAAKTFTADAHWLFDELDNAVAAAKVLSDRGLGVRAISRYRGP